MTSAAHTARRASRLRRPREIEDLDLTNSQRIILRIIWHLRYATPELAGLFYEHLRRRGRSHVATELGKLWRHDYLERDPLEPWQWHTGSGSSPMVYRLGRKGAKAIFSPEEYRRVSTCVGNRARPKRNLSHCLAISTLQTLLECGTPVPKVSKFYPDQESPRGTIAVTLPGEAEETRIKPDATVVHEWPETEKRGLFFYEVDLSPKREHVSHRFEIYLHFLTHHREDLLYENGVDGLAAVFIGGTNQQCIWLRDVAEGVIGKAMSTLPTRQRPRFLFWNTEAWFKEVVVTDRRAPTGAAMRRVLRDAAETLASETVVTLDKRSRPLFLSHS